MKITNTKQCSFILRAAPFGLCVIAVTFLGCWRRSPVGHNVNAISGFKAEELDKTAPNDDGDAGRSHSEYFQPTMASISLPDDKPADVPILPGAVPTMTFGKSTKTIRLEANTSITDARNFYISALNQNGWDMLNEGTTNIQAQKADKRHVNIDLIPDGNILVVSVQYR